MEKHDSENSVISIHAAREGGDPCRNIRQIPERISIHAAREGGDNLKESELNSEDNFNPRRP